MPTAAGVFDPAAEPVIAERRNGVLLRREWFPSSDEATASPEITVSAAHLAGHAAAVSEVVASAGIAELQLDRPLSDGEFIDFGRLFGTLIPESDPEISEFITQRYILDLRTQLPAGAPAELQPFAEDPLTFHTEGSRRPAAGQPRFLIFQCIVPPPCDSGGQTLLRGAGQVSAMLPADSRSTLAGVAYDSDGMPPLYRSEGGGMFSFRDFADTPLAWRCTGQAATRTAEEVHAAFRDLLLALYDERHVRGIWWQANSLVIIRNQRFFHGRSAAAAGSRHLRRLRVL